MCSLGLRYVLVTYFMTLLDASLRPVKHHDARGGVAGLITLRAE